MMTKASFFMQDHLRRNYAYITDVHYPTSFFCRGRLSFPQGLSAIAILFHQKTPADVYAHPYFVEKQSDPSQPSPQLHITEELQGIIKVQRGLRYMKDDSSKLDDTMSIVTDYEVPVKGQLLYVQTMREQEEARAEVERLREEQNRSLRPDGGGRGAKSRGKGPSITFSSSLPEDVGSSPATSEEDGGVGSEVTPAERDSLLKRRIASRAFVSSFMYSGANSGGVSSGRMGGHAAGGSGGSVFGSHDSRGGGGSKPTSSGPTGLTTPPPLNAPTLFPSVGESLRDKSANYSFFKTILNKRIDERAVSAPIPPPQVHLHEGEEEQKLFKERLGGFTVLYNPVETNDRTFSDLIAKLNEEEKVVKCIVVPTRHAWRQAQIWADAFPEAQIISSGPIPVLREDGTATSTDRLAEAAALSGEAAAAGSVASLAMSSHNGITGMQDFGNGVTGMSFPEVDLEFEAAATRATAEEERKTQPSRERAMDVPASTSAPHANDGDAAGAAGVERVALSARVTAMLEERERKRKLEQQQQQREEDEEDGGNGGSRGSHAGASHVSGQPQDPADFLWSQQARGVTSTAGFAGDGGADLTGSRQGGLRIEDAGRVRDLSREGYPDYVQLTPSLLLFHVKGDKVTEEYVLYDYASKTLHCTDLFHGQYADLDPLNSWMCRVWFKFMKQGNHKRVDIVPRFKWRQVCSQGTLTELQRFVDWLTTSFEIANIVMSHGTPPFTESPANALRLQWDLDPLPEREPATKPAATAQAARPNEDSFLDWEAQQQQR